MKRNVFIFGTISGIIVAAFMAITMALYSKNANMDHSMYVGFAGMLLAFTFIFVGIKNYRDKYNGGIISFGQAFLTGLFISLIASSIYVLVWVVEYYLFIPDFMENYSALMIKQIQAGGYSAAEMAEKLAEIAKYKEMYKNPVWVVLLTYMEVFPVALIVTLVSALILKRKTAKRAEVA